MTDKAILQATRDLLTEDTWEQAERVRDGKLCLGMAACQAISRTPEDERPTNAWNSVYYKIAAQLAGEESCFAPSTAIIHFNDRPDTTLTDIHAVLDRAIEAEDD